MKLSKHLKSLLCVSMVSGAMAFPLTTTSSAALTGITDTQNSYIHMYAYGNHTPFDIQATLTDPVGVRVASITQQNEGTITGTMTGTFVASPSGFSVSSNGVITSTMPRAWTSINISNQVTFTVDKTEDYSFSFRTQRTYDQIFDNLFTLETGATTISTAHLFGGPPYVVNLIDLTNPGSSTLEHLFGLDTQLTLTAGTTYTFLFTGLSNDISYSPAGTDFFSATLTELPEPSAAFLAAVLPCAAALRRRRA